MTNDRRGPLKAAFVLPAVELESFAKLMAAQRELGIREPLRLEVEIAASETRQERPLARGTMRVGEVSRRLGNVKVEEER